ncbi:polypeptide N-acetylgalactosaminyltransferase 10-like [Dipodomys spectabilis]|uniref:polypeptide N-acetylgalactosaminyltransferase 10-like n=1 Tax=Dipodomys spectabilis TaxID=105255 RepID=UPI001C53C379|nr:polypeptide N-acetylgalactosaminyltransferase 10-like [Dipodomys spectabilis]
MRHKEKRLLQAVALVLVALVFLPNMGLWALYCERQPDGMPGRSGAAGPHGGTGLPRSEVLLKESSQDSLYSEPLAGERGFPRSTL